MFISPHLNNQIPIQVSKLGKVSSKPSTSHNGSLHVTNAPQLRMRIATNPHIQISRLLSPHPKAIHHLYAPISAKTPQRWRRPHNSTRQHMSHSAHAQSSAEPANCNRIPSLQLCCLTKSTHLASSQATHHRGVHNSREIMSSLTSSHRPAEARSATNPISSNCPFTPSPPIHSLPKKNSTNHNKLSTLLFPITLPNHPMIQIPSHLPTHSTTSPSHAPLPPPLLKSSPVPSQSESSFSKCHSNSTGSFPPINI
jgi:hypothetical protein